MTHIIYTSFQEHLQVELFNLYITKLPLYIQTKIRSFRNWQDAHRSLFGNLLLLKGIEKIAPNQYFLKDLLYNKFQKPYFDNSIDFNISHSGEYIVCSLSTTNKTGIDVEQIKPILFEDLKENFHESEWNNILMSTDVTRSFYKHWTQKEAFLKAVGMGLNLPLNEIFFTNRKIIWEDTTWFSQEIELGPGHICYLVTDIAEPENTNGEN